MPIETDNGAYAGRTCKCRLCGNTRHATFTFDYYSIPEVAPNGEHYLMCENCMICGKGQDKPKPEPKKPGYELDEFNVTGVH